MLVRSRQRLCFAIAIGLALSSVTSCAVSQQQEVQLGTDYSAQIAKELPIVNDGQVVKYISSLGGTLAQATDTRGLVWHFAVVDSKEVNAFAVPGGWVYVNRGLIERAQNMSQLAGVLSHEIGHVTRRHSVQQMQQMQGANGGVLLLCTLTKVCESGVASAALNVGGSALFAKFSRKDEQEADVSAVTTTLKAGIDPHGVPQMFRILLNERKNNPNALDAFFATHPLEESRITDADALIATYPASQLRNLQQDTQAFQTFRKRLLALPPSPTPKAR